MSEVITRESAEVASPRRGVRPKCLMSQEGRKKWRSCSACVLGTPCNVFFFFPKSTLSMRLLFPRRPLSPLSILDDDSHGRTVTTIVPLFFFFLFTALITRRCNDIVAMRKIKDAERGARPCKMLIPPPAPPFHFPPSSRAEALSGGIRRDSIKRTITRQT